jgi:hypothetical protein
MRTKNKMSKRLLTVALLVATLLVVAVYGTLLLQTSASRTPVSQPVNTLPPREQLSCTASETYPEAVELARDWQGDARLVDLSATWREPSERDLLHGQATWAFRFFSPSANQVYRAIITEGKLEGTPGETQETNSDEIRWEQLRVKCADALLLFLSRGGSEFLTRHHVTTVRLQLSEGLVPGRTVWMIAALSSTDRTGMTLLADALSGEIIETPETSTG